MVFGRKKKEDFKKGKLAEVPDEFVEQPQEEMIEQPIEEGSMIEEIESPDEIGEPSLEDLKKQVAEKEKILEEEKVKEAERVKGALSATEILDILQANTTRNINLLNYLRRTYGV